VSVPEVAARLAARSRATPAGSPGGWLESLIRATHPPEATVEMTSAAATAAGEVHFLAP